MLTYFNRISCGSLDFWKNILSIDLSKSLDTCLRNWIANIGLKIENVEMLNNSIN